MRKIYAKATNSMYGFTKTSERIEITFNGWDGKSYKGETRKMNVWTSPKHPNKKYVYVRNTYCSGTPDSYKVDCFCLVTDNMVVEQATGIAHPEAEFEFGELVDYELVDDMVISLLN